MDLIYALFAIIVFIILVVVLLKVLALLFIAPYYAPTDIHQLDFILVQQQIQHGIH